MILMLIGKREKKVKMAVKKKLWKKKGMMISYHDVIILSYLFDNFKSVLKRGKKEK